MSLPPVLRDLGRPQASWAIFWFPLTSHRSYCPSMKISIPLILTYFQYFKQARRAMERLWGLASENLDLNPGSIISLLGGLEQEYLISLRLSFFICKTEMTRANLLYYYVYVKLNNSMWEELAQCGVCSECPPGDPSDRRRECLIYPGL